MVFGPLAEFFAKAAAFLPPGLVLSFATAFIAGGKYFNTYKNEFLGSMLMIVCTFSAGKWIGQESIAIAWAFHAVGVIAADYVGGGEQVNPAVSMSMWCLGKIDYTEWFVRVAGQMGGGLISFPIFHALSETLGWNPFGGPEFNMEDNEHPVEAAMSEFVATFFLLWAIYILNWELHFGANHYIIKQFLTAVAIRALIEIFPTAGPAMNPMLATCWDVFGVGTKYEMPTEQSHYFVYWLCPFLGAILASITYAIYAGEKVFGAGLPVGPFKKAKAEATKDEKKKD